MKINDFNPKSFVQEAEDSLGISLRSDAALLAYLGFFVFFNLMNISLMAPSGWATYQTSNSGPPAGSMWVEGHSIHWADGTYEYYFDDAAETTVVTTSPSQSIGSVWIEGDTIHWVDGDGDERRYTQPQNLGSSSAPSGAVWEEGYLHFVNNYGDEMSTNEQAGSLQ